jgi:teichuronic acid biosynthesis glycosyltransferase TuaC
MALMTKRVPISADVGSQAAKQIHVLTLTPFYPKLGDEANGCFIAEPLPWTEKLGTRQTVIAVQPFYYSRAQPSHSFHPACWSSFFSLPSGLGLSSTGAFLFAKILTKVRSLHASNPVHLIHAHSALPCGHAAALISRELAVPFVVTVHGLDAYSTKQVNGLAGRWCENVTRMVYRSAQTVICVSEKVREQVVEGAGGYLKTVVVYNGVDTTLFYPMADVSESPVILSIGTLIPIKGHELLLRALAAIHPAFPQLSCKIIGEGAEEGRLRQLATELKIEDKVLFYRRQSRSQVADAMRECTIFALPSRYEALGCAYLEAMATAKPVIACSGQGIGELVRDGVNGLLVDPNDRSRLAEALLLLLRAPDLRAAIGQRAQRTVLERLTLEHQAAQLVRIYLESMK